MLKKGFLSCPSQGNRPLSIEEKREYSSSTKQGNRPLSKDDNGKGSSPSPKPNPSQGNRPLSMREKGKGSSTLEQGKPPLSNKGKGKASSSSSNKQGNRLLSKKGKVQEWARTAGEEGNGKGNPTSRSRWDEISKLDPILRAVIVEWLDDDPPWDDFCSKRSMFLESLDDDSPWHELAKMDPFERAMILESLDDDPWDVFCSKKAMILESLGDEQPWDDYCIERAMMLESLGDDPPWDDFCSKRAMMMESLDDDSPWDDFCSLDAIERASFLGDQPLSKEDKDKGFSSKQGNQAGSKKKKKKKKKGKGSASAHTAGKEKQEGNPKSRSFRDLNARMDPFEKANVLESLEAFCYLDPRERALYLESMDETAINDIYKVMFLEPRDSESEFGSEGGDLSPDTKERIGREFYRNFERNIEKAITEKSKNRLDLLDVEIFKSMLGKPNWIDTDDFTQQFSDVLVKVDGDVDEGRRLDKLRYLQSMYDAEDTKSTDAHSHTKAKSSGSSGKDSLPAELGMMGAGFIPVVERDEGMVKGNSNGRKDIESLLLHSSSDKGYSKAKAKTDQVLRLDPMDEAKAAVDLAKTQGIDLLGQEDFWVKKIAKMEIED